MNGASTLELELDSVEGLRSHIFAFYPLAKDRLFDINGNFNKFVNIYVNGEDIRFLNNMDTKITSGDEISIVPAMAGG